MNAILQSIFTASKRAFYTLNGITRIQEKRTNVAKMGSNLHFLTVNHSVYELLQDSLLQATRGGERFLSLI